MYYMALPHLLCESLMSVVELDGGHAVLFAALAMCIASQIAAILDMLLAARCCVVCAVALSGRQAGELQEGGRAASGQACSKHVGEWQVRRQAAVR